MDGQPHIKFIDAKQARALHEFKNIKRRLHKTTAAVWYNKNCREQQLTPKYISIKIQWNNRQSANTLKAATHFRINQEIKFLYIKKNKLNEQLYAKHLECATAWLAYWTTILETIDNSLQAEMEKLYNNLNKKLDSLQAMNHKHHKHETCNQQHIFYQCTINLTNINFTTEEQNLLDQGMPYCIPRPTETQWTTLILETEQAIKLLDPKIQDTYCFMTAKNTYKYTTLTTTTTRHTNDSYTSQKTYTTNSARTKL